MNNERLEKLIEFLKEEPDDPFIIYALAIEYLKTNPEKSELYFDSLLSDHPNYTGTYYHAARYFADKGDRSKAESIFKRGIEICIRENDLHAKRELQGAYNEFLFDEDEDDE